ncbi:alpha/beta hydrolase [Microbulbifer agarilyticus]|uniref:alpha/beta hydrolase n=1 Tax=Microbulbifer agarilyticus TaxID=260552 RepID=UPI001CD7DAF8|nr:alpha/beta hydrolase-fold protein [Microbulbifer agarilyticus]MCA0893508.1 hypothetical protein [Microbulbifer agarilyticus]
MKNLFARLLLCGGLATLTSFAFAQAQSSPASAPKPYTIKGSQVVDIHSQANGKDYELFIKLPRSFHNTEQQYPLVLVNDADYAFPLISSITRQLGDHGKKIEEVVLVGVSYSKGDNGGLSRTRDYTPTPSPYEKGGHSDAARRASGQSAKYIRFLADEVLPYLSKHYRIHPHKKIFVGHSFGGLLGASILFDQPEAFDYYILGSPSLWYDNKVIFAMESDYAKQHKALDAQVMMMIGEYENGKPHSHFTMVDDMLAFEQQLESRDYAGLEVTTKVIPEEYHVSVFPTLITDGLLWAIPRSTPL